MSDYQKVTIVGPLPPPAGGMANQTKKLAEFLRSEGKKVQVVQVNASYKPAFIGKVPIARAFFRLLTYKITLLKQLRHTELVHIMANSGWSWHLFATPAILIARLYNKPVILNYRGGHAREFFDKSWFWVNLSLKRVQAIVVPSPFLEQVFSDFGKQALIVPNVLDRTLFTPKVDDTEAVIPHLIVTRNLEAIYDVASAIKSFAIVQKKFPKAKLSVAGTGPERAALEQLVESLNVVENVTFTGRLEPAEMAELYQNADLMLNTSIVDNTPNSIIESLACATPVVSTNVGGIPKLVTHQHDAYLVNAQDFEKMAEYAITILDNEEERLKLIQNGLSTISKFYWSNVWQKLNACYLQAITKIKSSH
jgi:glycosyltransferase involved in cell wall biosynthesis